MISALTRNPQMTGPFPLQADLQKSPTLLGTEESFETSKESSRTKRLTKFWNHVRNHSNCRAFAIRHPLSPRKSVQYVYCCELSGGMCGMKERLTYFIGSLMMRTVFPRNF